MLRLKISVVKNRGLGDAIFCESTLEKKNIVCGSLDVGAFLYMQEN
jgi:hypothetical protein